jgi:hypothetical protein
MQGTAFARYQIVEQIGAGVAPHFLFNTLANVQALAVVFACMCVGSQKVGTPF